uniref:Uncharacterized protein n=1 Tax=Oryza nivara TaxID=4536 RepID=A0A0E0HLI2_ORYNI
MDARESLAKSLEAQVSDSTSGALLLRCNQLHIAATKQLIASLVAINDTLEELVDAGFKPLPVDEFLKMIRDIGDAGETMAAESMEQIDASLKLLLASLPQEDDDNGGCGGAAGEEGIGGDGTQLQISRLYVYTKAKLSDSPSGSLLLRCNLLHLATTRQLIASLRVIYDTLEEFVDAGFIPLHSDDFLEMIRDIRDAGETLAADSLDQIDASLAALFASLPPEDDDNGGGAGEEGIGGEDTSHGTQLQISCRL